MDIPAERRRPFVLPYASTFPQVGAPPLHIGGGAAVLGRATLGKNARLGARSVIRADGHFVKVGDDFSLGQQGTVHIAHDLYPAIIGDRVTVGRNAVVHACTLGSDIVVGDDAVILDGSVVPDHVIIEARSIVFPRSTLLGGKLYAGMPAKPVRDLRPGEVEERAAALRERVETDLRPTALAAMEIAENIFVAATARLRGRIVAGKNSSIWFGCSLDAGAGDIRIGENTNIQDNTEIDCGPAGNFDIGPDSTIGHNVTLGPCTIGARSLIGIGSLVAPGTVVEDDVFLAAGAETTEGQVLESGWLWGNRPARKIAPLDEAKRTLIRLTVEHYCRYAQAFAEAQRG
jgi:carbonic anhydrase/acetyltransferase-like protein (isoleucine patch superfamily)